MGNHLSSESSPYLLQHADNPVDWYPWCADAFERARRENKPVFLSVGYSSCHWCHVMAQESFEDETTAKILNQNYISVKVDREERPDIDSVYMAACQALSGSGGWPMSVFLTPEQKPFYAGTYFPPSSRYGMVGFKELIARIAELWQADDKELVARSEQIMAELFADRPVCEGETGADEGLPGRAFRMFAESYDRTCGGFGRAPKFPSPHNLLFLLLYGRNGEGEALAMAEHTLMQMRRGGIFDQIGYGFSRYSTDRQYLVPHFEKMLCDNALLIMAYAAAYRATGNTVLLDTAEKTADYILRELGTEEGAFGSAQDADSDGEEGKFYTLSPEEVCLVLGERDGAAFCRHYGITRQGNFEGKSIPNLLQGNEITDAFEEQRRLLYCYRKKRASLVSDDKILTSWNALAILAFAVLFRVSGKERFLAAAKDACRFIERNLSDGGLLYASFRKGQRGVCGFLDDYAYYAAALIGLYEVTGEERYFARGKELMDEAERQFADPAGGYFLCGPRNDSLITRPKETYDGALPGGNGVMAYCLVRLSQMTDSPSYRSLAEKQLAFLSSRAKGYPAGHAMLLIALLYEKHPPMQITAVVADGDSFGEVLRGLPLSAAVRLLDRERDGYRLLNGKTTCYVCSGHTCLPPANLGPEDKAVDKSGHFRESYEGGNQ